MRIAALLPTVYAASLVATAGAQSPRVARIEPGFNDFPGMAGMRGFFLDEPRAVIGITTASSSNSRDTLGVLVSAVRSGSPAEKAGIEEGSRIASVNGVSLKLAAADVGDYEAANAMTRRLTRELEKLKPGDEVDLRIVANGQAKSVKVKTVSPDDLYDTGVRRRDSERATLGLNLAMTGTSRDTIGVFVMGVDDNGPAAKAGIQEGARIASINGVDVRGKHGDDEDGFFHSASNVNRLEREVSRLKVGDVADLRVYYNGQMRDVKVTAGRFSDRPHGNRTITVMGGDNFAPMTAMVPAMPALPRKVYIDGGEINARVKRALDNAHVAIGGAFAGFGNRVRW
jgi:S1-C subfamily serine protease